MSKKVSRRQFLTYTLGGTAGFLGAGMLYPMVRYAIDPVLKKGGNVNFVNVRMSESEITESPKAISFKVDVQDGWYNAKMSRTAWVFKENGKVVALSPVCKHLGCTVTFEGDPRFKGEFYCPCHGGRYFKDGINVPGTPPLKPLDKYSTKIENGYLLIGPIQNV